MKSAILEQVEKQSTFTGDVLEQLTVAHAEHLNRHGPVFGLSQVAPPDDAAAFAAEQRRKGEVLAVSPDPRTRAGLLLDIQAHQHEQIGRLAVYVAGYELAHGDKDKADPMRELGRNHLGLAAELRETMRGHFGDDFADLVAPKSPEPSKADDMNKRPYRPGYSGRACRRRPTTARPRHRPGLLGAQTMSDNKQAKPFSKAAGYGLADDYGD